MARWLCMHRSGSTSMDRRSWIDAPPRGSGSPISDATLPRSKPSMLAGAAAILITHLHLDHLDFPTLKGIGRDTPLVVPRGAGSLFGATAVPQRDGSGSWRPARHRFTAGRGSPRIARRKPTAVARSRPGARLRGARFQFGVPARRYRRLPRAGRRALRHRAGADLGLGGPPRSRPQMTRLGAAEAVALIAPKTVIPIHYGTYATARRRHPPPDLLCPLTNRTTALGSTVSANAGPRRRRVIADPPTGHTPRRPNSGFPVVYRRPFADAGGGRGSLACPDDRRVGADEAVRSGRRGRRPQLRGGRRV